MSPNPSGRGRVLLLATVLAVFASGPTAAGQQQPPRFEATVELVQMQVGVVGSDGAFVSGLTADDFRVQIDGIDRPVQVVYEIDLRRAPVDSGTATVAAAAPTPPTLGAAAARRHFLLLFDFSYTTRRGVLEARRAAGRFLDERIHPDDLVAVATANRYGIELLSPFTGHHKLAREAVNSLGLADASDIVVTGTGVEDSIAEALAEMAAGPGGDAGALVALPAIEFREYVAHVVNYTEQLRQFGEMLQAIEGRKHVVLFSTGFRDSALTGSSLAAMAAGAEARASNPAAVASADPEMLYGVPEVRESMREVVAMFRNADAVIHAVDPAGLRQSSGGHQALSMLGNDTGGSVNWNINDLDIVLAQIDQATASYYMIAYRKAADDPPTVDVKVEVVGVAGAKVSSAPTRLTPPPDYRDMNPMQRQLQLAEFMNDDVERHDIEFDLQVVGFPDDAANARAAIILEVPGLELDRLASERGEDSLELEIGGFALNDDGEIIGSFRHGVVIDVGAMRERGPLFEQRFLFNELIDAPPGDGRLRLLLREAEVGRLSSRTRRYWLPVPSPQASMTRPLLLSGSSQATPPGDEDGRFEPLSFDGRPLLPLAAPRLQPGARFRLLITAYHVPRHPDSGEVLAGLVLEVEDADGEAYLIRDLDILGSSWNQDVDATQMIVEASLPRAVPSGSVRLWARLIDQVTGARLQEQTPVYVEPR